MSATSVHMGNGDQTRPANLSIKTARRVNGTTEPLARFGEAKKVLGDIYSDLNSYVYELRNFYEELVKDKEHTLVDDEQKKDLEELKASIEIIQDTFKRDTMKVVFFGRTSNGKSTTINAMLHDKVLPQGMGHTTCCFLQVEGCPEETGYIMCENSTEKLPLSELRSYGHALGDTSLLPPAGGYNRTLRIFQPRSMEGHANRLLQNDVVIVDSPGVDVSPEFDSWIDSHCLDADVFVLVANAESTLTQAEKAFFHRVAQKLSRPNIFILNNRWDASACDSMEQANQILQVRHQHEQRFKQFLLDELHVCSEKEVGDRIFFVSARETLESRLKARGKSENAYQQDGHQARSLEFQNFERQFEQCISKSAIQTKFEAHNRRAHEIVTRMRENIEGVQKAVNETKGSLEGQLQDATAAFNECREQFARFEQAYKVQMDRLREEVHLKVSVDFAEEIVRLESVMEQYETPFSDGATEIALYKQGLAKFADERLSANLEARCTGGLMTRIWNIEMSMFQCVKQLLPESYHAKLEEVWRYHAPFKFSICVDVPSLVVDFHEDLDFRFSFGLSAIIRKVVAYRSGQPVTAIRSNLLSLNGQNVELGIEKMVAPAVDASRAREAEEESAVMTQMILTSAAYVANGGVGLMLVGGIMYKVLGWRVIVGAGALYGSLYAYERLRWNSSAKEQHLKEQFRQHLAARMQQVAIAHTTHCETQAVREMQQVYEGLRSTVGGVHSQMKENMEVEREKIDHIDKMIKGLSAIKGKTAFVIGSLEQFASSFLKTDSPAL